ICGLGIPRLVHGFTTRLGGVSEGGFASLNVSAKRGDSMARVEENIRRIAVEGGFAGTRLHRVPQVHGTAVLHASEIGPESQADALWWDHESGPGVISVTTADCVPILIVDPLRLRVAAIHSGWRGAVSNIVESTLQALCEGGGEPAGLFAAIGPCIERDAF